MLGVRDPIAAMKQMLVMEERIGRLGREVAAQAKDVNREPADPRREVSDLRDRVSRMEGAFAVIQRLQSPGAYGTFAELLGSACRFSSAGAVSDCKT